MRNKVKFTVGDITTTRICKITNKETGMILSYLEAPGVSVEMQIFDDHVNILKSGLINLNVTHRVGVTKTVKYEVNMNGNIFNGDANIYTSKYIFRDNFIHLEFIRDEEIVVQTWEIE